MSDDLETTRTRRNRAPKLTLDKCPSGCDVAGLTERIIRVERDVLLLNRFLPDVQKQTQAALASLADSNQRMAVHMEEGKRHHERMDSQDAVIQEIKADVGHIERAVSELRMQSQMLIDFTQGLKRFTWIFTTAVLGIAVWLVQRWIETSR